MLMNQTETILSSHGGTHFQDHNIEQVQLDVSAGMSETVLINSIQISEVQQVSKS